MVKVETCPCTDYDCEFNPVNHDQGCTLCVRDSVRTNEIPKCFFEKIGADLDKVEDWTFEAFAKEY